MNASVRDRFRALSQAAVDGTLAPYEAGWQMWGLAARNAASTDEEAWALWLIWGQLTDRIELFALGASRSRS